MAKASVYIAIFLISFNAAGGMLIQTGIAADLNLAADSGNPDELDKAKETGEEFEAGQGGTSTLFGLYGSLAGALETVFNAVMPGAAMLKRIGIPGFYINFGFTLAALVPALDIIAFLRSGGDLL